MASTITNRLPARLQAGEGAASVSTGAPRHERHTATPVATATYTQT